MAIPALTHPAGRLTWAIAVARAEQEQMQQQRAKEPEFEFPVGWDERDALV